MRDSSPEFVSSNPVFKKSLFSCYGHDRIPFESRIQSIIFTLMLFCASHKTDCIEGETSCPEQIIETAPASDWDLNEKDIEQIEQLLAERQAKLNT